MSDEAAFSDQYSWALSLPEKDGNTDAARCAALSRAHELRMFEIENYWKRATYFWAFQVAAFALLGLIWQEVAKASPELDRNALLIPAGLGAITAQVGLLTARGSKFWQANWESHVDALEGDFEGRLTQVVFVKGREQFSVSRVNERLLWILTIGWFLLFAFIASRIDLVFPWYFQSALAVIALALASGFVCIGTRTKLHGLQISDLEERWSATNKKDPIERWHLVLRDTALGAARAPDVNE